MLFALLFDSFCQVYRLFMFVFLLHLHLQINILIYFGTLLVSCRCCFGGLVGPVGGVGFSPVLFCVHVCVRICPPVTSHAVPRPISFFSHGILPLCAPTNPRMPVCTPFGRAHMVMPVFVCVHVFVCLLLMLCVRVCLCLRLLVGLYLFFAFI